MSAEIVRHNGNTVGHNNFNPKKVKHYSSISSKLSKQECPYYMIVDVHKINEVDFSDSKEDTLKMIYSQIVQGKPVVIQVNGNKAGTSRHFVTVVGFRNSITDASALTEKDLLIIDSWDGKLERMDQANSRFMVTGAQCHKKDYSGYRMHYIKQSDAS